MNSREQLLQYAMSGKKQAWVGRKVPYDMDSINIIDSSAFRMDPSFHRKYDIVWYYENLFDLLGEFKWKICLDELIRLLKKDGMLVIRLRENENPSLFMLKEFLFRDINIDVQLDYENCDETCRIWTCVFKIHRKNIEIYEKKDWTFGILTSGKKVQNVLYFLDSIRKLDPMNKHEIIISGPKNELYEKFYVKYINMNQFRDDKYAEIAKKKNVIVNQASNTNVMIVHDRFMLNNDFFIGFEKYGYDFDFLTVKQFLKDGREFPCQGKLEKNLIFSKVSRVNELNFCCESQFINGGILIFKKRMVENLPLNDMLMWNQMEDVAYSERCIANGIVPRVNYLSSTTVLEMREGYLEGWDRK